MKRIILIWLFSGWLVFVGFSISAPANVGIVEPLVISKDAPVHVKFPGSAVYIELIGIHQLPADAEIAADTPASFRILCPDLTVFEVAPGAAFACPKQREIQVVVDADADWTIRTPRPKRPLCELQADRPLTEAQQDELADAERQIRQADLDRETRLLVFVALHVSYQAYSHAIEQFEPELRSINSPETLRLLGYLYYQGGDACRAAISYQLALEQAQERRDLLGEAVARDWLAKLAHQREDFEQARQHAESAIKLYQQLGLTEQSAELQPIVE